MMLRRWVERNRRRREERIAFQAATWLEGLRSVLDLCRAALQPRAMPGDLHRELTRIDWRLERVRSADQALKRYLRQRAPALAPDVEEATGQAFHLRNQTTTFFIRWQAFQDANQAGGPMAFLDRREMEEALLQANQTSRALAEKLDTLGPGLRNAVTRHPNRL